MSIADDIAPDALAVADALRDAESSGVPIPQPSQTYPGLTLQDAYRIQTLNIRRRREAGERIAGRKVGLTSLAMQQQVGVDQPDYGVITDAMVLHDGGQLALDVLIAPRVEAEFAFLIGADLPPSPTIAELSAAVAGVAVSMEIIDSRVADWKIGLVDTVCDNASSARIVYGEFQDASPAVLACLPAIDLTLLQDGTAVTSGPGAAVLGDPLIALHWLSTTLGTYGDGFSAGEVVLAGAVAAAVPLTAGSSWSVTAPGFAGVSFSSV